MVAKVSPFWLATCAAQDTMVRCGAVPRLERTAHRLLQNIYQLMKKIISDSCDSSEDKSNLVALERHCHCTAIRITWTMSGRAVQSSAEDRHLIRGTRRSYRSSTTVEVEAQSKSVTMR